MRICRESEHGGLEAGAQEEDIFEVPLNVFRCEQHANGVTTITTSPVLGSWPRPLRPRRRT